MADTPHPSPQQSPQPPNYPPPPPYQPAPVPNRPYAPPATQPKNIPKNVPGAHSTPSGAKKPTPMKKGGNGAIPKNYSKTPGGTREDVNGRVNTNLIQKLQNDPKLLEKMKRKKVAVKKPTGSFAAPPPPPAPKMTHGAPAYAPPAPRPTLGVSYPSVQLKAIGAPELLDEEENFGSQIPEENSTQTGSEKVFPILISNFKFNSHFSRFVPLNF